MTDPNEIAVRLTKAQRQWLLDAFVGSRGWRIAGMRPKACELGLCYAGTSRLTPLGLSVRQVLLAGNDA